LQRSSSVALFAEECPPAEFWAVSRTPLCRSRDAWRVDASNVQFARTDDYADPGIGFKLAQC